MKFILLPPFDLLLLLLAVAIALVWRGRRWWAKAVGVPTLAIVLMSLPLVSGGLLALFDGPFPPPLADAKGAGAQAIVILSAGVRRDEDPARDELDDSTSERVVLGARLARETGLPVLVTGAVNPYGGPSVAELMQAALVRDFGLPPDRIWIETHARTTHENATLSVPILRQHGVARVLLVTEFWHMPRSAAIFRHEGLDVVEAPVGIAGGFHTRLLPDFRSLELSYFALYEGIGRIWYRFMGWI